VCTSITKGAGFSTPIPAAAKMHVLVTRRFAVALARVLGRRKLIRNRGSGSRNALDSRGPLARGLLLLGGRRFLGLLAAARQFQKRNGRYENVSELKRTAGRVIKRKNALGISFENFNSGCLFLLVN
jgi:hypothetical protein